MSDSKQTKRLLLFDVDGTLTDPRKKIEDEFKQFLQQVRKNIHNKIGIVGGSDLAKIKEQLGDDVIQQFDYVFAENGLVAFKDSKELDSKSISEFLGEANLKIFLNFCLKYLSEIDIPIKRGTFIEFRRGMLNISPIGRNCSQKERDDFEVYDIVAKVREKMISKLKASFPEFHLTYSIGGQISFDVFPTGWDKSYCLKYIEEKEIHFFGDKTFKGGNDYEIYISDKVKGHAVKCYHDTKKLLEEFI